MKFLFEKELIEGVIKGRPNRFIMNVLIHGKIERCHCPSTGQIASIIFNDIPCLVSDSADGKNKEKNTKRKTRFTVEAISLDPLAKKEKQWIGINQTMANKFIEFFLKNNLLPKITHRVKEIKREAPLGKSRIDFLINGRDFLEVKTPLKDIPSENHPNYKKRKSKFLSFDRIIKHFREMANEVKGGSRAILLMCYIYDAPEFRVPEIERDNMKIVKSARVASNKGLENWQINLKIDKKGVELIKYFKLNLFDKK
jgi:sugar fermentation stimulation protein A